MGIINPVIVFPWNYCHKCKTNSLELYSWHEYAQKYQKFIDLYMANHNTEYLDRYAIFILRCSRCGEGYSIFWDNGFPKPIYTNQYMEIFMNSFKEKSLKGKVNIISNIYEEKLKGD